MNRVVCVGSAPISYKSLRSSTSRDFPKATALRAARHTHRHTHAHNAHTHTHTHNYMHTHTHTHTLTRTHACTRCARDGLCQSFSVTSDAPSLVFEDRNILDDVHRTILL